MILKLKELAQRVRKLLPTQLETGFPHEWEYPQVVTVRGLVMPAERCWPLRMLPDGRKPTVTSKHFTRNPERKNHFGCDLFYRYDPKTDPPMKLGDGGRTQKWWIPNDTVVVAQAEGEVVIAGNSATGYRAWVRHEGGLATGGFHLTQLFVKIGDSVAPGDPLGIVGDNPRDNDARHLHTELYKGPIIKYPAGTLDPELFWIGAQVLPAIPYATEVLR